MVIHQALENRLMTSPDEMLEAIHQTKFPPLNFDVFELNQIEYRSNLTIGTNNYRTFPRATHMRGNT